MNLREPPAIRENLPFIRWTGYRCPHCREVFRIDFWPYNVRLGSGERICDRCGKVFDDGAREWPELKLVKRVRFFLPPGIIVMAFSFLIFGIGMLVVAPRDVVDWQFVFIVLAGSISPILIWCLIRLTFVRRSVHRYQSESGSMRRKTETA
jgi:hypothetical protein